MFSPFGKGQYVRTVLKKWVSFLLQSYLHSAPYNSSKKVPSWSEQQPSSQKIFCKRFTTSRSVSTNSTPRKLQN